MSAFIPRLYTPFPFAQGGSVDLSDAQVHYLVRVLRLNAGAVVKVFNGHDGEWSATLQALSKKKYVLVCDKILRDQSVGQDIWLAFAPLKKTPMEFLIEKATELGISHFLPLKTQFSDHKAYRPDKAHTHAIEAAQQSEQLQVPLLSPLVSLSQFLREHPKGRLIYVCLERQPKASCLLEALEIEKPITLLIGPEGGFSPEEQHLLTQSSLIKIVTLGSSILRAETAAIVSVGCAVQKMILKSDEY